MNDGGLLAPTEFLADRVYEHGDIDFAFLDEADGAAFSRFDFDEFGICVHVGLGPDRKSPRPGIIYRPWNWWDRRGEEETPFVLPLFVSLVLLRRLDHLTIERFGYTDRLGGWYFGELPPNTLGSIG